MSLKDCAAGLLLLYFTSLHYNVYYEISTLMFNFCMLLIMLPSLVLICVFVWKILCLCTSKKRLYHSVSEGSLSDVLPDREIRSSVHPPIPNNTAS